MASSLHQENNVGFGFGKTILFGEHFVVHGLAGLVVALPFTTKAVVKKIDGASSVLIDNRPKHAYFKATKTEKYQGMLNNILAHMGVSSAVEIELSGDLKVTSGGIGASAATAVAIARALNNFFALGWSDEAINQAALAGEKSGHGNPSGIDNAAACFGGSFVFQKYVDGHSQRTPVAFNQLLYLVLIDSGIVNDTHAAIADFKALREEKPHVFDEAFESYQKLFESVLNAVNSNDLAQLGKLMCENHAVLKKLHISNTRLDEMVEYACQLGALGAKLTGTGRGGLVVALAPDAIVQFRIAQNFEHQGYEVIKISL